MRIVTGTVGIGKSTTGYAVAERAAAQGRPAAFLDVDELTTLARHLDRAPELVAIQDRKLQLPVVDASGSLSGIVDAVLGLFT